VAVIHAHVFLQTPQLPEAGRKISQVRHTKAPLGCIIFRSSITGNKKNICCNKAAVWATNGL
jgi:hypothetical protein